VGWPQHGGDGQLAGPTGEGQAGPGCGGVIRCHSVAAGSVDRSGRSSTVLAASRASRAKTWKPLLNVATGIALRTPGER